MVESDTSFIENQSFIDKGKQVIARGFILVFTFMKSFMKDRKSQILILLGIAPSILLILMDISFPSYYVAAIFFTDTVQTLYIALLLPLFGLLLGTAALSEEIESHTIVQLVSRPIRRFELVFWRYFSTVIASLLVAIISLSFLFVATGSCVLPDGSLHSNWGLHLLPGSWLLSLICSAVYCAIFSLLGVALEKPLFWGVVITLYEQLLGVIFSFFGGGLFSLSGHIFLVGEDLLPYVYSIPDWSVEGSVALLLIISLVSFILSVIIFQEKDLS
ncbi:MAG: ABC transporter permease subunit [Candidatus Lokiarchaeota archaeon]|nr:ABC transporter permease subunit [Candidatus Lokiarchaeota archaeon]